MRVGLVLPSLPGYSQTFFRNKINSLVNANFEVFVFADNRLKSDGKHLAVRYLNGRLSSGLEKIFALLLAFFRIISSPGSAYRLIDLNRTSGLSWKESFRSLYLSSHIIGYNLDWLHFGFATMAIGRENLAKAIGAKMAVSLRGFDISVFPIKNPGCYSQMWKCVDKLHYISDDLLRLAAEQGFKNFSVAHKITPAIDLDAIKQRKFNQNHFPIITTTARLHWIKGLEDTLEALALIKQLGYAFRYQIIGDGPDRERLIFATHQLGLENQVLFCGKLPHSEVFEKLCNSDLYIQYSYSEGFCNSVIEAQATGVFCIVSDAEGLSENVLNEQTGLIVPKRKPEKLAEAIVRVLEMSGDEKHKFTSHAIERVRTQFDIKQQSLKFIEFYTKN